MSLKTDMTGSQSPHLVEQGDFRVTVNQMWRRTSATVARQVPWFDRLVGAAVDFLGLIGLELLERFAGRCCLGVDLLGLVGVDAGLVTEA